MTIVTAMKIEERILTILNETPGLTDRELTDPIKGRSTHPSEINQACRSLEGAGRLTRQGRLDGRIGNYPNAGPSISILDKRGPRIQPSTSDTLSEDQVKFHLKQWLDADGWQTEIAWGKARGTDIVARRIGKIWLIEAKGCGSRPEMRVNYFVAMLGEVLQRMSVADARYSIALPDMVQFRRLWGRLPTLARQRTGITALFVTAEGAVDHVANAATSQDN
jgi:hypothetical protein